MSPVSILPIIPIILLALATVSIVARIIRIHTPKGGFASIDGLRGYLAFFVFLHHSAIWYFYLRSHQWGFPPSRLFNHFGPSSVALFFMITSFLFISKLLNARSGAIDWVKLYTGRVFRILPLYLVAIFALFIVVAFLSDFKLYEPLTDVTCELFQWISFMEPDINSINGTRIIIAAVAWSLAYEWLFYFSLTFIGFFLFKIKTRVTILLFTGLFLAFFFILIYTFYPYLILQRMSPFLGGIAAAFLARNQKVKQLAVGKIASMAILSLLVAAVLFFPSGYECLSLICISFAFIGIACGNTLFGSLTNTASRLLGQISYGIYLLHGILLFLTFRFILGFPKAGQFSPVLHWATIAICGMFLVLLCSITYKYIELLFINAAPKATTRIENYLKEKELTTSGAS